MQPGKYPAYALGARDEFIITEYNSAKPFSSFFPGVAGPDGIPMWTFYVNRGQCVCSMGIQDKEHAIMEFLPANRAYQLASTQGFRTFIKTDNQSIPFYEPFQKHYQDSALKRSQRMIISPSRLTLEEENESLGLTFSVEYHNIPQDDFAGLIRTLKITSNGSRPIALQALDGLPLVVPYGVDNGSLKFTRRLVEAFVEVVNQENNAPLFRGKVEPVDRPEVVRIQQGNFYLGFMPESGDAKLITPVVDPAKIFGSLSDYSYPEKFLSESAEEILTGQVLENRFPCAMGMFAAKLLPGDSISYTSIIGHAPSVEVLNGMIPRIATRDYVAAKSSEDRELIEKLTQGNFICSREPALDQYTRQNYLDNGLRGGFPITLKGETGQSAFYMYSRKHGDLERDYNHFSLSPSKYSQGNANYRDINQNRRNDLFFNPDVGDENVEQFYNLIQLDGFNPLVIREVFFSVVDRLALKTLLDRAIGAGHHAPANEFLGKPFTPGSLMAWLQHNGIRLKIPSEDLLGSLLGICRRITETEHGEGFWTDHWTYNLDLLENYLALYPENEQPLLFEKKTFTFYDNAHRVQCRDDKYVLWDGNPMQLNAVVLDEEKAELISRRGTNPQQVRTAHGQGEVYYTTLACKILCLIVNKLASLDPHGVGVEMEADKPNWYDALNGMPGVLGSSISETLEIKRNVLFLKKSLDATSVAERQLAIFEELETFFDSLYQLLLDQATSFDFWDRAAAAKETFRERTRLGISGREKAVSFAKLQGFLDAALAKLDLAIEKSRQNDLGVLSTYFIHQVTAYSLTTKEDGSPKTNLKGMPCFRAEGFKQISLPLFLEGPVHYLRTQPAAETARELAQNVRLSGLYDQALQMYKVNASLEDQPMEIGRARVFSPGWFENESVWLHMEYKYMLELLRNGLYEEFYRDFKNVFVPFFDPSVYGRSTLENSSFIVSSANPDRSLHGNGFVARLSGATAEFMSIMLLMSVGPQPFRLSTAGELELQFRPALPDWLFTVEPSTHRLYRGDRWQEVQLPACTFSFMFLGEILVTYHNPEGKSTFGPEAAVPVRWTVYRDDEDFQSVSGPRLSGPLAEDVRKRKIQRIEIEIR
ncbi:MAG: hypothetical protein RQ754_10120 [Desulfuromonadales bacterium]|nr:hypothetical protein [Desulfuromonadales bacterium]